MSERKLLESQVKAISAKEGLITRLVSAFGNVDAQNDRVLAGAYTKTISKWERRMASGRFLPVVFGHKDDPHMIIGKVIGLRQTEEGLEVDEKYFLHKPAAKDAFEAQAEGVLDGSSFAYDVLKARRGSDGVRDLIELDLIEVGPTIYPANDATRLVSVKAVDSSSWDGSRAMSECDSAADFRSICAGERSVGEPDERQHWALPHHYLGRGPNARGVAAAIGRFDQTEGLKNAEAARRHLEAHMSEIRPDDGKSDEDAVETKVEPETLGLKHNALRRHKDSLRAIRDSADDLLRQLGEIEDEVDESSSGKADAAEAKAEDHDDEIATFRKSLEQLTVEPDSERSLSK